MKKLIHYLIGIALLLGFILQSCSQNTNLAYTVASKANNKALQSNAALREAAILGDIARIQQFLEKGYDLTLTIDSCGAQFLHYAAKYGHTRVIELLIENNVDVNGLDKYGRRPLHYAAANGHVHATKLLLEKNADADVGDKYGRRPLHDAAENGCLEVVKLLLEKQADPDIPTLGGSRPLHIAAASNSSDAAKVVKVLLEKNVAENTYDEHGNTPLYIAAESGYGEVVELLLQSDSDATLSNGEEGATPLHVAAKYGDIAMAEYFLKAGVYINVRDTAYGSTPLHLAIQSHRLGMAKFILEKGADPTVTDHELQSPLHLAATYGYPEIIEALLAKTEDKKAYINSRDGNGDAALHLAVDFTSIADNSNNIEVVKLLLQHGADINTIDRDGYTPLGIAIRKNMLSIEIVEFLVENGADVHEIGYQLLAQLLNCIDNIEYAALIKYLLSKGVDFTSVQNEQGDSFLHIAATKKLFDIFLQAIEAIDTYKNSLLKSLACSKENSNIKDILPIIVKYIYDIDWNLKNNQGKSILTILEAHREEYKEEIKIVFKSLRKRYKRPNVWSEATNQ